MDKIIEFDQSKSRDDFIPLRGEASDANKAVTSRSKSEKRWRNFSNLSVGMVRSEGGRIWRDFNALQEWVKKVGAFPA